MSNVINFLEHLAVQRVTLEMDLIKWADENYIVGSERGYTRDEWINLVLDADEKALFEDCAEIIPFDK